MTVNTQQLKQYIADNRPRFEDLLGQLVEVPSISMDPARAGEMPRAATLAVQYLKSLGADAHVVETGGYPIISGGWTTGADYPTVTIYNHLDVQPAQEPEWKESPFAFRKDGGIYHGRGATDDKGPALSALLGARYAIEQGVPINIRFLWELEEEIGSPHFAAGLQNRLAIPRPDSVVVSDTIWIAKGKPAMPYGLRGLIGARLTLKTGTKDAHSGVTGGASAAVMKKYGVSITNLIGSAGPDGRFAQVTGNDFVFVIPDAKNDPLATRLLADAVGFAVLTVIDIPVIKDLAIMASAMGTRFILQTIPFVRWGS